MTASARSNGVTATTVMKPDRSVGAVTATARLLPRVSSEIVTGAALRPLGTPTSASLSAVDAGEMR